MSLLPGVLVVAATFVVSIAAIGLLGLPWGALVARGSTTFGTLRHSLWWGLAVASALSLGMNQFLPLGNHRTALVLLAAIVLSALIGIGLLVARKPLRGDRAYSRRQSFVFAALGLLLVVLAVRVLGPVTNYDTGLYHLGAISYAQDYSAIPGLANLYFAYGYATTQFPLAAMLTWSPLGDEGYRALNSIILLLACVDLFLRILGKDRSAGKPVLLFGLATVIFTMVPLADYWLISPTQDASVFVVTVVASAYVSEVLTSRRWIAPAATAVILALTAVTLRSTMAVFALVVTAVVVAVAYRRRHTDSEGTSLRAPVLLTLGLTVVAVTAVTARDYRLSGWLQYPLSLVAFDVPWRAAEPTAARLATLGAARDPGNLWVAAESWSWIGPWWSRALSAWELYAAVILVLAAVVTAWVVRPPRLVLLAIAPSIAATAFWYFATPPSFRFIWGPLFSISTIVLGWSVWKASEGGSRLASNAETGFAGLVLLTVLITAAFRLDFAGPTQRATARGIPIEFSVVPVRSVAVATVDMSPGLSITVPGEGDQCWSVFPLCAPQLPPSLSLRGTSLQEGLTTG